MKNWLKGEHSKIDVKSNYSKHMIEEEKYNK